MNQLADYDRMVHDAFAYAKEGVYERTDRWIRLILGTILLGIPLSGYIIRIYRGATAGIIIVTREKTHQISRSTKLKFKKGKKIRVS